MPDVSIGSTIPPKRSVCLAYYCASHGRFTAREVFVREHGREPDVRELLMGAGDSAHCPKCGRRCRCCCRRVVPDGRY
ncbi:MAG: hypothetical protein M1133_16345 [Armatimonadetes bacterium]|nr:hypothetical protein [Armatimonadota bacterium]